MLPGFDKYPIIQSREPLTGPLSQDVFEEKLVKGWRFLGSLALRHSISYHYDELVITIPGRIRLQDFEFSESQLKTLRKGKRDLRITIEDKNIILSDYDLFDLHRTRFDDNPPVNLLNMVSDDPNIPYFGKVVRIYHGDEHVATSWFHFTENVVDGTYCVYNPDTKFSKYSLGNLTLLLEIEQAIQSGCSYYYLGYRYHIPSHFDYKANFNNLERLDMWSKWVPCRRIPPRKYSG